MKNSFLIIFPISLLFCNSCKDLEKNDTLKFGAFPLAVPEQNSLAAQWEKKIVLDSMLIDDMESSTGWESASRLLSDMIRLKGYEYNGKGIGEISYTQDRAMDGKQSLRFSTSLRDTGYYRQTRNRTEWDTFDGDFGGISSVLKKFDVPQDWSAFNRISLWVYVHPTTLPTYCLSLGIINEGTVPNATTPREDYFAQNLIPGKWNHILFEIPHLKRDKVILFRIGQELIGHDPQDEGIVTYDFDRLELQRVEADQYEGWNVAPGKFSFSHIGYRPEDPKSVLVGSGAGDNFQLIDKKDSIVFSGNVRVVENRNGVFHRIDFSEFREEGIYRIRCGSLKSNPFPVNKNIWLQPVFSAINFYFCERCGYPVPGIHKACHLDWQGFHGDEKKIINGGWHDAADYSQGSFRTAMACFAMMRNLEVLNENTDMGELADRIRSEIAWGLEWLLKTRFGDGFHISFGVMRIYTDNKIGTVDDVLSPARNVPWENFLAAAVECEAAEMLKESHSELASKSGVAAVEDWKAAMASRETWDQASYQEAAWGVTSSILLGKMTGEEKYKEQAVRFGNLLMKCQEQVFVDSIPITGYFYTNTNRERVIHNNHTAFEEAPMIALAMLCKEFPENENWMSWYSATVLYSEFFMKRGSQIAVPFDLLPNSVWKKSEIMTEKNAQRLEDNLRQFNDGTPLNKEYRLRTFPIWRDDLFHGSTNIQMSGTWALAEAARLRNDPEGMQLVGKQLQWVLGANPFGQSLMYGVGYDFSPMHAVRLKDIVGSLPVGMDCMSGDKPFWSVSNYGTVKEIWTEPVSRFLGAVSVYTSQYKINTSNQKQAENIQIHVETVQTDKGIIDITITLTGTGRHEIELKAFNTTKDFEKKQIDLSVNKTERILFERNVIDRNIPYIALISVDNNPVFRKEIVGSFINSQILSNK